MILKKLLKRAEKTPFLNQTANCLAERFLRVAAVTGVGSAPKRRFVILMQGRAGSSFFCDLLDQHSDIRCQSELLNSQRKNPLQFLRDLSRYYGASNPVWGFKFKPRQVGKQDNLSSCKSFLQSLSDEGYQIFSLVRENSFRVALSVFIGVYRGHQYHNVQGALDREKVTIPPEKILSFMKQCEVAKREIRELSKLFKAEEFVYEEDLEDADKAQKACDRVFSCLGVEPMLVKSSFKKTSGRKLSDDLFNAEEMFDCIAKTEYKHFLEGVRV